MYPELELIPNHDLQRLLSGADSAPYELEVYRDKKTDNLLVVGRKHHGSLTAELGFAITVSDDEDVYLERAKLGVKHLKIALDQAIDSVRCNCDCQCNVPRT